MGARRRPSKFPRILYSLAKFLRFVHLPLQLTIGLIVFRLPYSRRIFVALNNLVIARLDAPKDGTSFLLGRLSAGIGENGSIGFILAFQPLPIAIFSASIISIPAAAVISKILLRYFNTGNNQDYSKIGQPDS